MSNEHKNKVVFLQSIAA